LKKPTSLIMVRIYLGHYLALVIRIGDPLCQLVF